MPEQSGENVLSVRPKEMARRLGVSERTLWTWTKKNEIPHVKVGTGKRPVVLYPVREVETWLARRAGGDPGRPAGPTPP